MQKSLDKQMSPICLNHPHVWLKKATLDRLKASAPRLQLLSRSPPYLLEYAW